MNKKIYIIPGWQETCKRKVYKNLTNAFQQKGYEVVCISVNWKKVLSKQVFQAEKDSVVFGFSMGAILARLVAQKYAPSLTILGSMTPLKHFQIKKEEKILADVVGKKIVDDVKQNLEPQLIAKHIMLYGDKENEKADIYVPDTDHEITENYIKELTNLL